MLIPRLIPSADTISDHEIDAADAAAQTTIMNWAIWSIASHFFCKFKVTGIENSENLKTKVLYIQIGMQSYCLDVLFVPFNDSLYFQLSLHSACRCCTWRAWRYGCDTSWCHSSSYLTTVLVTGYKLIVLNKFNSVTFFQKLECLYLVSWVVQTLLIVIYPVHFSS